MKKQSVEYFAVYVKVVSYSQNCFFRSDVRETITSHQLCSIIGKV